MRQIRPEYQGIDPADRITYEPGKLTQCDLWFPETRIPVAAGQERILPVLVMTLAFSRLMTATMIPSRQGGDILSAMWTSISQVGRVTKTLLWDRESAIGGTGKVTTPAVAFAGTSATQIKLAPPRDPEYKGMVERHNDYLETSFLPGRRFASPDDFNDQLGDWLVRANSRTVRSIGGRPIDLLDTDYSAMLPLPPMIPPIGLHHRIRLARDYYVRMDAVDYSVDPRVIGRFVDVADSPSEVVVTCEGRPVTIPTGPLVAPIVGYTADGQPVYGAPVRSQTTSTFAILAFIFGLLAGGLGIVFGHIALSQIKRTGANGRGMAIAGLILGYHFVAFWLVVFIAAVASAA